MTLVALLHCSCTGISTYIDTATRMIPPEVVAEALKPNDSVTTSFSDASMKQVLADDFGPKKKFTPLATLPRGPRGGFLLRQGFFEFTAQSFGLDTGAYGFSGGNGYLYAPLKGARATIIQSLLRNAAWHPEIPQHQIQALLWSIQARAKLNDLHPELREVAKILLTSKEISEFSSGPFELLQSIPEPVFQEALLKLPAPARQVLEYERRLRRAFLEQQATYEELKRIAVLTGVPPPGGAAIPFRRWSRHSQRFYIRYIPESYDKTRIQLYVPASLSGENSLEYDPSGDVAVTGNTACQRLLLSARPYCDNNAPCFTAPLRAPSSPASTTVATSPELKKVRQAALDASTMDLACRTALLSSLRTPAFEYMNTQLQRSALKETARVVTSAVDRQFEALGRSGGAGASLDISSILQTYTSSALLKATETILSDKPETRAQASEEDKILALSHIVGVKRQGGTIWLSVYSSAVDQATFSRHKPPQPGLCGAIYHILGIP